MIPPSSENNASQSSRVSRAALADARRSLTQAPRIPWRERSRLLRQGRADAKSGVAYVDEGDGLRAPFLETLAQDANADITASWNECNGLMFRIRSSMEEARARRTVCLRNLEELFGQREQKLASVRGMRRDGDESVSDYLANKRMQRREELARDAFDKQEDALRAEIRRIEVNVVSDLERYRDAADIGMIHEEIIRREYLRRLAIYVHGASRYIKVTPEMVNDAALSDEARLRHIREFGEYDFSLE